MPTKLEELEAEALNLDPESRAKLVASLTQSLKVPSENEAERLWIQEAMKRSRELREGQRFETPHAVLNLPPHARSEPAIAQPRKARRPAAPARRKARRKASARAPRKARKKPAAARAPQKVKKAARKQPRRR